MAKRIKIGLIFGIDSAWIAGSYYLMNLVHALNLLDDTIKPHIVFLNSQSNQKTIESLNYPYYSIKNPYKTKRNYFEAAINKVFKFIFRKDIIVKQLNDKHIDCLYPASFDEAFRLVSRKIFWIPDFQHHYYPQFFTKEELDERNDIFRKIAQTQNAVLVLSSNSAFQDFKKYYPNAKIKVEILPFAVTHPEFSHLNKQTILEKYNINKPYYIVTNQFWQHKNHLTVLEALQQIVSTKPDIGIELVMTGKGDDYRSPGFFNKITNFIEENNLKEYVKLTGFIARDEQLLLIKNSIAVIQPSLFEGWSTVVEDAKALNKFLILSNLPVHKEQIDKNVDFFDPLNKDVLAQKMIFYAENKPDIEKTDYSKNIKKFGENFFKIIQKNYQKKI